jgi:hypothetical protein
MKMSHNILHEALPPVQTSAPITMGQGDWLQLEHVLYKDNAGIERKWERCIRKKARSSDIDGNIHA